MIIEHVINILFPFYDNLVNVISNEREFPSFNEFTRRLQLKETHNGNRVRIKVDEANLMVKFQKIFKNKLVVHDAQVQSLRLLAMYYKVKFEPKIGYCKKWGHWALDCPNNTDYLEHWKEANECCHFRQR
jgi:hypothetical protein